MVKDWCPLCGTRFQGLSCEEVAGQIISHMENGKESFCAKHFVPPVEAFADRHYDYRTDPKYLWRRKD